MPFIKIVPNKNLNVTTVSLFKTLKSNTIRLSVIPIILENVVIKITETEYKFLYDLSPIEFRKLFE